MDSGCVHSTHLLLSRSLSSKNSFVFIFARGDVQLSTPSYAHGCAEVNKGKDGRDYKDTRTVCNWKHCNYEVLHEQHTAHLPLVCHPITPFHPLHITMRIVHAIGLVTVPNRRCNVCGDQCRLSGGSQPQPLFCFATDGPMAQALHRRLSRMPHSLFVPRLAQRHNCKTQTGRVRRIDKHAAERSKHRQTDRQTDKQLLHAQSKSARASSSQSVDRQTDPPFQNRIQPLFPFCRVHVWEHD